MAQFPSFLPTAMTPCSCLPFDLFSPFDKARPSLRLLFFHGKRPWRRRFVALFFLPPEMERMFFNSVRIPFLRSPACPFLCPEFGRFELAFARICSSLLED